MIKVKEIMTKNPVEVEAGKTVREAVQVMTEKTLGSLLVRKGHEIIGILEESDVLKKVLAKDLNPYIATVESVMSIPFIIDGEKSDNDASDIMSRNKIRHLVVSDGSAIIGILSMQDLLRPVYSGKTFWT
ncbi:MAG TPA: CBS domain-containing protein [Nitrospiria bacterium]|nr:CBS domain-containing protein [Nitrospiria bacterium]